MKLMKNVLAKLDAGQYSTREICLSGMILFLIGVILGMLISPRKRQMIGCYNGSKKETSKQ